MRTLQDAFELGKSDMDENEETKFKIQELHILNNLKRSFSDVKYNGNVFDISRKVKNNNLVETNMSALTEVYDIDPQFFKDTIGTLNWKKFGERIKAQLAENQVVAENQKAIMRVNAFICFTKANAHEEAAAMLQ